MRNMADRSDVSTAGFQIWPRLCGLVRAMALALSFLFDANLSLAQEPSAGAIAAAKELLQAKGAANMFDPVVPGAIETAKNTLLRTNINLAKELNEVAAQLRTEYANKRLEILEEMARTYARHFTEAEVKDALAFYKTPLGKKLIEQEPRVLEETMTRIQNWADRFADEALSRIRAEMKKRGHNV